MAGVTRNPVMCRPKSLGGLPFKMESKISQEKLPRSFAFRPFPGRNPEVAPEGGTATLKGQAIKATSLEKQGECSAAKQNCLLPNLFQ